MPMKMSSRERLRRCYCNEQLDRPGIYIRDAYPQNDVTYDRLKAFINSSTDLKYRWSPCWTKKDSLHSHHIEPYNKNFDRHVSILYTPCGNLKSVRLESLKGQPGLQSEYLLKTRQDAEMYLSLPMNITECEVSGFFESDQKVGHRGITEVQLGLNPAGFVAELFGSEMFAIISVTDRDIIHQLCQQHMSIIMEQLKFLADKKVGPYFAMLGQEYIVPPLHSPADFYDFNVKYDKLIIDFIHEIGGRIHIHSHGSIKKVFRGFIDMGVDVLHPIEAPPMGDITASEAKDLARNKICLEGNIQIASMYENSPDQIHEETITLINNIFDDGKGLIVCPTASPYMFGKGFTCFEQFKTMIETVLEWHQ